MLEERIPIEILGQTYEVIGNPSEALYYTSLARYVEEKMREIQKGLNIVSSQKVAVLAALNIADELFRERENQSHSGKSAGKKLEELIKILDRAVQPEEKPIAEPAAQQEFQAV